MKNNKNNNYIERRLDALAASRYKDLANSFKDEAYFRCCLRDCYALVAFRTCQRLEEHALDGEWFELGYGFCEISSKEFLSLFPRRRIDNKKKRVPYSRLLDILAEDNIIKINNHYSSGGGGYSSFCKSYLLHYDFMAEAWAEYEKTIEPTDKVDWFKCFAASYPRRLINVRLKEAKKLYAALGERSGLKVVLPEGWENDITSVGRFAFNDSLEVDELMTGLCLVASQKKGHYKHGRYYDWFTLCPSSFREYIYKGSQHYRELVDCPSGFMWMFALYGVRMRQVSVEECQKMIDHCFKGTFYSDVSGSPKTPQIKMIFMMVLNMKDKQVDWLSKHNEQFKLVMTKLKEAYPEWSAFLEKLRRNSNLRNHMKMGRFIHKRICQIEKKIMNELKKRLEQMGYKYLKRVHDAIFGLEDVKNIDNILYEVVEGVLKQN